MSALPGNWFTVAGRAVFYPPSITLADVQAAIPEFKVFEGITPTAQAHLDACDEAEKQMRAEVREFLEATGLVGRL